MKRVEKFQQYELRFCRVYKEELQEVINLMTVGGDKPKIESGDFEFDSAEDLFNYLGDNGADQIEISRSRPSVSLTSRGFRSATIRSYGSDDVSLALFQRVVNALRHCERRTPFRAQPWSVGVTAGLTLLAGFNAVNHGKSWASVPFICLAVFSAGLTAWLFKVQGRRDTLFFGVSRAAQKSFWQRKRDDILVAVISATLGGILGVAGTLVTQALSK
ncbi:hypothetical protein [Paraburkholderia caledonica]|uniref:Uncharacterized protein n=1 Tax=Paraburkholderia caledonica TaxID=134536 RepID=A0AB73I8D8_9BURK|nr:hypothetical protein [Paraburkholderia caledonica]